MDPISQMALGAALPAALESAVGGRGAVAPDALADRLKLRSRLLDAMLVGAIAGAAPDLDVLLRSEADPLMAVQFHRHFTHALVFVPVLATVVAGYFYMFFRKRRSWWQLWRWAALGALTHGLLDACTGYGTHLAWPFSNARVALNFVSVIDPLYTVPLLVLLVIAIRKSSVRLVRVGLLLSMCYLSLGMVQQARARSVHIQYSQKQGIQPGRHLVKPAFANLWLWRAVVEDRRRGVYYVDAVWVFPFLKPRVYPGGRVRRLDPVRDFPQVPGDSTARKDLERFDFFSDGYVYKVPGRPREYGDLRFSLLPNSVAPLWVIRLPGGPVPDYSRPLPYITARQLSPADRRTFQNMLVGRPISADK